MYFPIIHLLCGVFWWCQTRSYVWGSWFDEQLDRHPLLMLPLPSHGKTHLSTPREGRYIWRDISNIKQVVLTHMLWIYLYVFCCLCSSAYQLNLLFWVSVLWMFLVSKSCKVTLRLKDHINKRLADLGDFSAAESARAVTGRQCPHSGDGGDFLTLQQSFFYENGHNSGTEGLKIVPNMGI